MLFQANLSDIYEDIESIYEFYTGNFVLYLRYYYKIEEQEA